MEKLTMERRAYDNKYLHRDFHASIDNAIAYVGDRFGEEALDEYIRQYVKSRYTKMTLAELEAYFVALYAAEEAEDALSIERSEAKLSVRVAYCPGLRYLQANGGASRWYGKTTSVLYQALAERCGLCFTLHEYDAATGKAAFDFTE